jgi:hypothetical protein
MRLRLKLSSNKYRGTTRLIKRALRINGSFKRRDAMEPPKQYNGWEKANVVLAFLTPLAIAGVGYYLNEKANDRATAFSQHQSALAQANADREDKRERLALIPAFIDALTGPDQKKKELAVKTIQTILPEDFTVLLVGLEEEQTAGLSAESKAVINSAAVSLAEDIFSHTYSTRDRAFTVLASGSIDNDEVVRTLLSNVKADPTNEDGVVNALQLLNRLPPESLTPFAASLREAFPLVSSNGDKTSALTQAIEKKLQ